MEELNQAIDDILCYDEATKRLSGRVCMVCDKLLKRDEYRTMGLTTFARHAEHLRGGSTVTDAVRGCYTTTIPEPHRSKLKDCLLSPRSKLVYSDKRRRSPKIMLCQECKSGMNGRKLKEGRLPRYAIANGMTIGTAPECLTRLNEIELALVSQARFKGHLFTYWGGCHRSIKGWHSFYEVDAGRTAAVLDQVAELTEATNIGVILTGPFTPEQKEKVLKKTRVNTTWVREALEWLKKNNRLYAGIGTPRIGTPVVVDNSEAVESENTDIESKEEIKVVFPDGTIRTGGCTDGEEFTRAIAEIRARCGGTVPYLTSRPSRKILRDYEDETLMRAFPLQFPYGEGYHEDFSINASQNGYLKHLLSLSIPAFHESCFVLTVHNIYERGRALTGSIWRVLGGGERCDVSEEELNAAIEQKLKGLEPTVGPGKAFLESVEAVKRNLAHSNGASKAGQSKFLSLNHHFGCPKLLFTVAFDDSLDIRILALSGEDDAIGWVQRLEDRSAEEVVAEMDRLSGIRYRYPGLCAYNFESLMDVVLDKIIGDNEERRGMFGNLDAYGMAVEEQGRKTLHAHILVYTSDWSEIMEKLHSSQERERKWAERKIQEFVDNTISTQLVPDGPDVLPCPECAGVVEYAGEQQLRNLRHKHGCQKENGIFAKCIGCGKEYQGDELAVRRVMSKDQWNLEQVQRKAVLSAEILAQTLPGKERSSRARARANLLFNQHLPFHTRTCFKKGDEGRCQLPDIAEPETRVVRSNCTYNLHAWTGEVVPTRNVTVRPRRLSQDAYTNSYCKAITDSHAPSNSNIQLTTGARSSIYASCYVTKNTQKEDTSETKKVGSYVANRFLEERKTNQVFEGLSRLMGAVIVGTNEHVCAAPMAAYLVRNGSRFKFSHGFQFVPVKDMTDIITKSGSTNGTKMSIDTHEEGCFLTNLAVHYLRRPKSLESCSAVQFFEEYEIVRNTVDTGERETYDLDEPDHPGYSRQLIRKRHRPVLAQFSHWAFPDAGSFGGDIRKMSVYPVPASVEQYCRTVLTLFRPFRTAEDLTVDGSYHKMFKRVYHDGIPARVSRILSNVQMFYNSMRLPAKEDPLYDRTVPFKTQGRGRDDEEEEEEDEDNYFEGVFAMSSDGGTEKRGEGGMALSLKHIRKEGGRGCGFFDLPEGVPPPPTSSESQPFLRGLATDGTENRDGTERESRTRDKTSPYHLMELKYRMTRRRVGENGENDERRGPSADGTASSILAWSEREELNFDDNQRLAFQIVTASFVLTYYKDAAEVDPASYEAMCEGRRSQVRRDFNAERRMLTKLARLEGKTALRMFLDGAGGAGKSHVVGEVMRYAEEFTTAMGFTFDMRTIVVTAMSGVAAVSIRGETLHGAAAFAREIKQDDTTWANARLLIVDEVSFMSTSDVETLDEKLRTFMTKFDSLYGGLHVLFCGDFSQLEPVSSKPLYTQRSSEKTWVNTINCYVELMGLHRFKDDPEWGQILRRLRTDTYTQHDIDRINERVIKKGSDIPPDTAYCVYGNKDRTAINAAMFSKVLEAHWKERSTVSEDILLVKASKMSRRVGATTKKALDEVDRAYIYEHCGDSNVRTVSSYKGQGGRGGHFVDPLLKLYHHAPLMLVSNDDVPNGHANGTRVRLEQVVMKDSEAVEVVTVDGRKCKATDASNVEYFLCSQTDNPTKTFKVKPREMTCNLQAPVPRRIAGPTKATIKMKVTLTQVPVVVNHATTGHKLQGQTKERMVISVWSKRRNWNYVALSRVRTRNGLFLVRELPYGSDFSQSADLRAMMATLRQQAPADVQWSRTEERELLQSRR